MTHFDEETQNWIDFNQEDEEALASYGAEVANGSLAAEEAFAIVARAVRARRGQED